MNWHLVRRLFAAAIVAVSLPALLQAQQAKTDDPVAKRLDALEAAQKEILKQLQDIKALLQSKPVTAAAPTPAPATNVVGAAISINDAAKRGNEQAKLVLIEYSDFQCPFCGRYFRETYSRIQHDYVDGGKIYYVFRNLPLEGLHPLAFGAAVAAECARKQGKFWEMHDRLYGNQQALNANGLAISARGIGLDMAAYQVCVSGDEAKAHVRKDLADAAVLGANATPAFFLAVEQKDGSAKILQNIVGAKTYDVFKTSIDTILSSPALQD